MSVWILDATTKSITITMTGAPATTNPDWMSAWADDDGTTVLPGSSDGTLNGTTPVTVVAAPAISVQRIIKEIVVYNRDTAAVTFYVKLVSGGTRFLKKVTLAVDESFTIEANFDTTGAIKTAIGTVPAHGHTDSTNGGTLTHAAISDWNEAVDDRVAALVVGGAGIDVTYDDPSNTLTIDANLTAGDIPNLDASKITTGALAVARGGTGADNSASDGFLRATSGAIIPYKWNMGAVVAPSVVADGAHGYAVGSIWLDTTAGKVYICLDNTAGAAVWKQLTNFDIVASDVLLSKLGSPTYYTLQDMQNVVHSTGWVSGGAITDNGNGTIAVATGQGLIRASDSNVATLYFATWSTNAAVSLTDGSENWVYIQYNAGTPNVVVYTSDQGNHNSLILLAVVFRSGTELHINIGVRQTVGDHAALMMQAMAETMPFANSSGGLISATGTRNFAIGAGVWWTGLTRFTTNAFDSSGAGRFNYYYRNGSGGWTKVTNQSQIGNTQYDNGSGALATLSNNQYGVFWVYLAVDGDVTVQYGQGSYTLTEANAALVPAMPPELATDSRLVGKIIIKKSDAAFTTIQSALLTAFSSGSATDHNGLTGLQGGTAGEYYHLTAAQYSALALNPNPFGGRLTLTSATPFTVSDVTGAGTLYLTPVGRGSLVSLYNGSSWDAFVLAEKSLALTLTSGKNYDVFLYNNAGTLTLELSAAWTNDTTRADALALQDGAWVKSADHTRRYIGTIRASGTNTTEDSNGKRFVWNYYNRTAFRDYRNDPTNSWTDAGNGTWSAIDGGYAAWKHEFVIGLDEYQMKAKSSVVSDLDYYTSIAIDSTTTPDRAKTTIVLNRATGGYISNIAEFNAYAGIGYHYLQGLETTRDVTACTAYGDNGASIGSGGIGPQSGFIVEGWR